MNGFAILIVAVLVAEFVLSALSSILNLRALSPALPDEFGGVFDADRYARSQEYTRTGTRFDMLRSTVNLIAVLVFWQAGGFAWLDTALRGAGFGPIVTGLLYVGTLALGSMVIGLPFRIYSTFVIEQRFGFNRTTLATFAADLFKGMALMALLGGIVLGAVLLFVAFEAAFMGFIALGAEFLLGPLAWTSIAFANVLAAGGMGYYLWRKHPKLRAAFAANPMDRTA